MKTRQRLLIALVTLLLTATGINAAAQSYSVPKREFRSAWVATVWRLDWPHATTVGTSPETVALMKAQMDRMLDTLAANNFNAVNFQVRSMCDAMYRSKYEPWSSYISGTRGLDPGWDPLAYCVEGCHRRGLECHAWINPYRLSSNGIDQWSTDFDKKLRADGRLLQWGQYVILDPAQQVNIDHIVNVCKDIITNYDVDGILYDDYFYPSGIPCTAEAGDYDEWQQSNVDMTMADWRRDNVNRMVQAVYDMIQATRADVRFGISPAGVAGTSSTTAGKYGVEPCPSGGDWQYNDIFSDPLAWLDAKSIDYLSPQVYWPIGASADYGKITPWWGRMAQHFGRHVFISQSISSLNADSDENAHREYVNEVELTRTSNLDGAPGSIFYSCHYLYRTANHREELANVLHRTTFSSRALTPPMAWKPGSDPGAITGLASNDYILSWNGFDGYKYSIYAIPNSVPRSEFSCQPQYLLGVSYSASFALPEARRYGFYYAVCPVDRMSNEFSPTFLDFSTGLPLDAPTLLSPADGEVTPDPCTLAWSAVDGAQGYLLELATDAAMTDIIARRSTTGTQLLSSELGDLKPTNFYWRVRACAEQRADGVSQVRSFIPQVFTITYPDANQMDVHPSFTMRWHTAGNSATATAQIATDNKFTDESLVFSGQSATGSIDIPQLTLFAGTTYYARVTMTNDQGVYKETLVVPFTTAYLVAEPPAVAIPLAGGTLYSDQHITLVPQEAAFNYQLEVSTSATVWGRTRYVESTTGHSYSSAKQASEIKTGSKLLADGNTYYLRARISYTGDNGRQVYTAYCEPVPFVYSSDTAPIRIPGDLNGDGQVNAGDISTLYEAILTGNSDALFDLNGDGSVNAGDISALYSIILTGN
ncbi:MAG: family 10 glycosylhydrolase [Muribaculaceae bacterium]|nr:family 10 glycosylhydrolase [Muribaculaceae bacterium]